MLFYLQKSGNSAIKNGLTQWLHTGQPTITRKDLAMATQPIHKEPENRQPFADADIEKPDWNEVWAGYERWLDEREETVQ